VLLAACAHRAPVGQPLVPLKNLWAAPLSSALRGPLATDGERIFAATRDSGVLALEKENGRAVWTRKNLAGVVSAAPGRLFLRTEDGTVSRLDPASGAMRWTTPGASQGALPVLIDDGRLLVAGTTLEALEAEKGTRLWNVALPAPASAPAAVAAACVLVGTSDGMLRCHDRDDGTLRWILKLEHPLEAAPAFDGERIFVGTADRKVLALDPRDGSVDWGFKLGATVAQTPTTTAKHALVASNEGVLYAFDRGNGSMAWRAPLPSRPLSPPHVADRQVVVACHERQIVAVDAATGKDEVKVEASLARLNPQAGHSEIRTPALFLDRRVYVGLRNPWAVLALDPGTPPDFPPPPEAFPVDSDVLDKP
jgi:outer membrane protein assembly factor BamB